MTELLTEFGEVFCVWFDNACGEGENGKKQVYDFPRYIELIRKYQPNATVFNDKGIIRWCGNEAGKSRESEWSVVPAFVGNQDYTAEELAQKLASTLSGFVKTLFKKYIDKVINTVDAKKKITWIVLKLKSKVLNIFNVK